MTLAFRVIARLDIKAPHLVKGVRMEGLRVVGDPVERALIYAQQGADEIHIQDIMASVYNRPISADIIRRICAEVFIPVCVGGGIRTVDDARAAIQLGCERVCVNTAAHARPELITEIAQLMGSQAVSVGIEDLGGLAMCEQGRAKTRRESHLWAAEAVERGAGEITWTSVNHEGMGKGYPSTTLGHRVPLVMHGGFGKPEHAVDVWKNGANGIQVASALHYNRTTIQAIKQALTTAGAHVRQEQTT